MTEPDTKIKTARIGVAYALTAFITWGVAPIYFKAVSVAPALEILAHRIVWSVFIMVLLVIISNRWGKLREAVQNKQSRYILVATTLLVSVNWLIFIWSIATERVLQASLGYFINPLVTVLLGMVFLRERLSRWGKVSILLASIGVSFQMLKGTELPWPALVLAVTFAFYGLLRKIARFDAVVGLTIETLLLAPLALGYLIFLGAQGVGHFGTVSWSFTILLICAGPITTLPLLWFNKGARRLQLSTIGFIQYITPSLHFILAVAIFGEPFNFSHGVTFGCIWTALIIYSIDTVRNRKI